MFTLPKSKLVELDRFDERIRGYGTNSAEFRLRLYFSGMNFKALPKGLATHLDHKESERTDFYESQKTVTLYENTKYLLEKVRLWEEETGLETPKELYYKGRIRDIEKNFALHSKSANPSQLQYK